MHIGSRHNQHSFAKIPDVNLARSSFDRSFPMKTTFDFDYLIPILVDEHLPGDTFNVSLTSFARLATQIVPIMDNMHLDFFFFSVPNRLVYDKWEQLQGATIPDPDSSTDYIMPQLTFAAGKPDVDSIFDQMGLPTDIAAGYTIKNTLPLRCYMKIWNDWFRDQNLQDSVIEQTDEGPDAESDFFLLKRGKRHDYFTSMLPWPQKGPAVDLPLGTSAPVTFTNGARVDGLPGIAPRFSGSSGTPLNGYLQFPTNADPEVDFSTGTGVSAADPLVWGNFAGGTNGPALSVTVTALDGTDAIADLSAATAATINQLRLAFAMQGLYELDARGGTRYVEILRARFGVISPDFRLQRSEFLGSGSTTINSHPVAQTSPTAGANAQAQLAAFATGSTTSGDGIGFTKSFVEHGHIIGLVCARADITYQQGVNRMWNRSTRFDFFEPKLQELGEQAVLNSEWFVQGTADDLLTAGYQERFAEYRYKPAEIHGKFRSTYATPLDMWHLAEEFSALPLLNAAFIVQNTPIERAIAIDTEPDLLFDAYFKIKCARPMMTYSVPATLGRF